jgi:hypothetical protein
MPTIAEIRQKYPQYEDLSDDALAGALHKKFYSDMPREEFDTKIGFKASPGPDVATDMAKGFGYGANEGIDATLNMIGAPIRAPINYISEKLGYGEVIPELNAARQFNVAGPAETRGGKAMQAVGEVAGASALPAAGILQAGRMAGPAATGILGQAANAPGAAAGVEAASAAGAGAGVATARDMELGPTAELAAGLAGGFAAPNVANLAARTYGGVKSGANYMGRQVERARNPEQAAYRDIADQSIKAGVDLDEIAQQATPPRSANLESRGFTQDDLADIITRQLNGEAAEDVASSYAHLVDAQGRKFTADTARGYLQRYQDANPTPMNLVDLAKEQVGSGNAVPLANQARTDMAIADDPVAAQRLIERQRAQPGRTAEIIEQSSVNGRNFEDEIDRLTTTARQEERTAYEAAHADAKPIELRPAINAARRVAFGRKGEIADKLNEATDLFFAPVMKEPQQSPATALRITKLQEKLDAASAKGASPEQLAKIQRDLDTAIEQDMFTRTPKQQDVGQPINNIRQFMDARQELDQMIAVSKKDGKATPLTAVLTEFRKRINEAARRNNPKLIDADARFSENRSIERILARGTELGKKLTPQTRQALREFRSMTPTQQELTRVAFERQMADAALNVKRGNAAADQFGTEAFDKIIDALYPAAKSKKGPARTQEQKVFERGQKMRRDLKREAISTETTRDALSGSRTAPLADDMAEMMEGPRAAADALTGRWGRVLENLSNRLTRVIGQEAARRRVRILTETSPSEVIPMLRRLRDEARTARERQLMDVAIREFAKVGRRPGADAGAVAATTDQ